MRKKRQKKEKSEEVAKWVKNKLNEAETLYMSSEYYNKNAWKAQERSNVKIIRRLYGFVTDEDVSNEEIIKQVIDYSVCLSLLLLSVNVLVYDGRAYCTVSNCHSAMILYATALMNDFREIDDDKEESQPLSAKLEAKIKKITFYKSQTNNQAFRDNTKVGLFDDASCLSVFSILFEGDINDIKRDPSFYREFENNKTPFKKMVHIFRQEFEKIKAWNKAASPKSIRLAYPKVEDPSPKLKPKTTADISTTNTTTTIHSTTTNNSTAPKTSTNNTSTTNTTENASESNNESILDCLNDIPSTQDKTDNLLGSSAFSGDNGYEEDFDIPNSNLPPSIDNVYDEDIDISNSNLPLSIDKTPSSFNNEQSACEKKDDEQDDFDINNNVKTNPALFNNEQESARGKEDDDGKLNQSSSVIEHTTTNHPPGKHSIRDPPKSGNQDKSVTSNSKVLTHSVQQQSHVSNSASAPISRSSSIVPVRETNSAPPTHTIPQHQNDHQGVSPFQQHPNEYIHQSYFSEPPPPPYYRSFAPSAFTPPPFPPSFTNYYHQSLPQYSQFGSQFHPSIRHVPPHLYTFQQLPHPSFQPHLSAIHVTPIQQFQHQQQPIFHLCNNKKRRRPSINSDFNNINLEPDSMEPAWKKQKTKQTAKQRTCANNDPGRGICQNPNDTTNIVDDPSGSLCHRESYIYSEGNTEISQENAQ